MVITRNQNHFGVVVLMGLLIVFLAVLANYNILLPKKAEFHSVSVITPSGEHRFWAEYARTPFERQTGLMNRRSLEADHGMLFLFDAPSNFSFWMKNTLIPLDMLFVDDQLQIQHLVPSAQPCPPETLKCPYYSSTAPVRYVLEIPGGTAERLGISVGDRIELERGVRTS